jgi:hypothetical protein
MLFGAVIASYIKDPILAVILAFLSHYLLDFIPHIEYSIKNITEKNWRNSLPDFLRVFLDFSFGILLILFFSTKTPIIFIAVFFAMLPDGISLLSLATKNKILENYNYLHQKRIHFFKYKKVSNFWRIINQVAVIVVFVLLLV